MLGQILLWPHFQNFTFQYCFLRLRIHTICTLHYWWSYEDKFEWWDTFLFSSSFFQPFFGLFFSFFFHPSLVFLETILRVDGFPIVSVLGSCCHHLLICTYVYPSTFFRICWDHLCRNTPNASTCFYCSYLCASWAVFLLLWWGLHSASTTTCTSVADSGHPWFSSQEIVSKIEDAEIDAWDRTGELAIYPLSYHIPR